MIKLLKRRKVRFFLFLLALIAGFIIHYAKYQQILPGHLHKIVELIYGS
jgi:hypothetical protein